MKANVSKRRNYSNDSRAQVGIGTMIVFIASVLVAAIAAGVLIGTSSKLQERSQRTGNEVTSQVASNLEVKLVQGKRDNVSSDITQLNITMSLAPGADNVDLSQARIQITNGTTIQTLKWTTDVAGLATFNTTSLRDADGSYTTVTPVMNAGDLVSINIDLAINSLNVKARSSMQIMIIPEVGTQLRADFTAPASFGTNIVIQLR